MRPIWMPAAVRNAGERILRIFVPISGKVIMAAFFGMVRGALYSLNSRSVASQGMAALMPKCP